MSELARTGSIIVLAVVMLGASPPPIQGQAGGSSPAAVEFKGTNADSGVTWAVTADFVGRVEVDHDALRVVVTKSLLLRTARYQELCEIVSVRAGISRFSADGSWKTLRLSEPIAVHRTFQAGEKLELEPFELRIPTERFEILPSDWLTFAIESAILRDGTPNQGIVYVQVRIKLPGASSAGSAAGIPPRPAVDAAGQGRQSDQVTQSTPDLGSNDYAGPVHQIGGGIMPPAILSKVEPQYTEKARAAGLQGTIVLTVVVDEHGLARNLRVIRSLGLGLDEQALNAVSQWRFRPGMKDGTPVATAATIQVSFRTADLPEAPGINAVQPAGGPPDQLGLGVAKAAGATSEEPSNEKAKKSYQEGLQFLRQREPGPALDSFKRADKQDGGHCLACQKQMMKYGSEMGDWKTVELAAEELVAAATPGKDEAQMRHQFALLLFYEGEQRHKDEPFARAHDELKKALASYPRFPDALFLDGRVLANLRQEDAAKARFEQYVQMKGSDSPDGQRALRYINRPELARLLLAPAFAVTTVDGQRIALDDLHGKVILLDFWATWCGPCRAALPHMQGIAKKFQGRPLVILSVSLDSDEQAWKNFIAKNEMSWPQYRDGGYDGAIARLFSVNAIPQTFTIDADGVLQSQHIGDASLEGELTKLLARARKSQ